MESLGSIRFRSPPAGSWLGLGKHCFLMKLELDDKFLLAVQQQQMQTFVITDLFTLEFQLSGEGITA